MKPISVLRAIYIIKSTRELRANLTMKSKETLRAIECYETRNLMRAMDEMKPIIYLRAIRKIKPKHMKRHKKIDKKYRIIRRQAIAFTWNTYRNQFSMREIAGNIFRMDVGHFFRELKKADEEATKHDPKWLKESVKKLKEFYDN